MGCHMCRTKHRTSWDNFKEDQEVTYNDKKREEPVVKVSNQMIERWEQRSRRHLNMMSYADWFASSTKEILFHIEELASQKEQSNEHMEEIINQTHDAGIMIDAMHNAMKDLSQSTVDHVGNLMLVRSASRIKFGGIILLLGRGGGTSLRLKGLKELKMLA